MFPEGHPSRDPFPRRSRDERSQADREIGRQLIRDGARRCRPTVQTWPKCPRPFVLSIEMREVSRTTATGAHRPRPDHAGHAGCSVAVADPDGVAPRRLVHPAIGRPGVLPGQPANRPSADRLDSRWVRELRAGDRIPDGPPGTAEFVVEHFDAPHLLLHSTTHLPGVVAHPSRLPRGLDLVLPPGTGRTGTDPGARAGSRPGALW